MSTYDTFYVDTDTGSRMSRLGQDGYGYDRVSYPAGNSRIRPGQIWPGPSSKKQGRFRFRRKAVGCARQTHRSSTFE
jgi:hypothetical protein